MCACDKVWVQCCSPPHVTHGVSILGQVHSMAALGIFAVNGGEGYPGSMCEHYLTHQGRGGQETSPFFHWVVMNGRAMDILPSCICTLTSFSV